MGDVLGLPIQFLERLPAVVPALALALDVPYGVTALSWSVVLGILEVVAVECVEVM